jgi:hypothetical protein
MAGAATTNAARTIVAATASAKRNQPSSVTKPPAATCANESANARTTGTQPSSSTKATRNTDDNSRPNACALVTLAPGTLPRTPR